MGVDLDVGAREVAVGEGAADGADDEHGTTAAEATHQPGGPAFSLPSFNLSWKLPGGFGGSTGDPKRGWSDSRP